jgi:3-dehydrosphinganine reductase
MEVKPYNISVTLSFPPDTDTPCLAEENKVKPTETKIIGDTAGVFQPSQVASSLLHDALAGDFFSATGFDGNVSTIMCAGMSPMSSILGLLTQVLSMGILRLVSLGYNCYFNHVVAKCASQKEKEKRAQ